MKVLKFGGTSVGSIENLRRVKQIITSDQDKKVVVCSAMSGVTDQLVALSAAVEAKNTEEVAVRIAQLKEKHVAVVEALLEGNEAGITTTTDGVVAELKDLEVICASEFSEQVADKIVTAGERLLTFIFSSFLTVQEVDNVLLDARDFMCVDKVDAPNVGQVGELLEAIMQEKPANIYITQGFVCRDESKEITTLKRGGSDYSATIIGGALNAKQVQIWTDIDGLHNNDPRFVEGTYPISRLTYNEAAELAYFGAKILHPQTVSPILDKNIPVYLKNTFKPEAEGTVISNKKSKKGLKAISAKDGITAIKIKSNRMLMAHGYLKSIFEIFDRYETSIDMITTSEVAISLTIDNNKYLDQIINELNNYANEVIVDTDQTIVCIVGESVIKDKKVNKIFKALKKVPIRMVSYGGSDNNISLLVNSKDKVKTLKKLNKKLFQK